MPFTVNALKRVLSYAATAGVLTSPAAAQWDPSGYSELERQTYDTTSSGVLRGAVVAYNRDMVTEQIGNIVYVHIVYASCPTSNDPNRRYDIKYRRGWYAVTGGPGSINWSPAVNITAAMPGGRFKMNPALAETPDHHLFAFWADSSQCNENIGVWDNIEIYGSVADYTPGSPASWTWRTGLFPFRLSTGRWFSDAPTVAPYTATGFNQVVNVFWRDGRAYNFTEGTDIYTNAMHSEIPPPPENFRVATGIGFFTMPNMTYYDLTYARIDAACNPNDPTGVVHVVWSEMDAGQIENYDGPYIPYTIHYTKVTPEGLSIPINLCAAANVPYGDIGYQETNPMLAFFKLPGHSAANDICVMFSARNNAGMYIFDAVAESWSHITPIDMYNAGLKLYYPGVYPNIGWRGALVAEGNNNVIHTVFEFTETVGTGGNRKNVLYYDRATILSPTSIQWQYNGIDQYIPVQKTANTYEDYGFVSLTLTPPVLHTSYRYYDTIAGPNLQAYSICYENDGGANYQGP